jgi:colanic acid biosynthesis glycosyl transferase WcaI
LFQERLIVPSDCTTAKEVKKKLWIVSEVYYPEYTSTAYALTVIAGGLSDRYDVRVLCGQPTYAVRGVKAAKNEIHEGVPIRRCWGATGNKDRLFFRIVNLITISLSLFIQCLWRLRRGDRVLVVTNPPVLPFFVVAVCRLRGSRCLLLVHDVYPEFAVAAGVLKSQSLLARVWAAMTRRLCQNVDQIAVLGRDMQEIIRRKRGRNPEDVHVITHWASLKDIYPTLRQENRLLRECGLLDKFVFQYAGNMGPVHDVEMFIRAAQLVSDLPNVHFLVIGSGGRLPLLKELIRTTGLSNFTVLPPRPRKEAVEFLNACDVALSIFVPGMYGVSVPSRIYDILAAAKPILAVTESGSELGLLLEEEQIGWVIPPRDAERFAQTIREIYAQRDQVAVIGRRARETVERKYRPDQIIQTFDDVFSLMTVPNTNLPKSKESK